jgi:hypothetical protein
MFKIDVDGLKELQKAIDDYKRSIEPSTFNEWAKRIAITAKQICNDPSCKRIKLIDEKEKAKFSFEFADSEAIDCIIKSIQTHLSSMPPIQQDVYKGLIPHFENNKKEMKSKDL